MMISEAIFANLGMVRRAVLNGHLAAMPSTLVATGEPVHMVAAVCLQGKEYVVTPFGMLAAPAPEHGVPECPNERLTLLQRALKAEDKQAWLQADAQGRPTVAFATLGETPTIEQALMVLTWDNPYELFSDPTA